MEINVKMKSIMHVRAFYLFFIISSIQLGVGVIGVPSILFMNARQDAWISIIIAFIYIVVVLLVMFLILNQYENADIFGIQVDIFGNWLGKMLGTVYIIYFAIALLSILITYIEVIKVFIFPELNNFIMGLLLLSLVVYTVLGGFRVIVGICFIFFMLTHWILFLLIEPALKMELTHFQPLFQASFTELMEGAKSTSYTFTGIEILFLVYPFIQNKEKVKIPVLLAAFWTMLIVTLTTVISMGFFAPEQLERREWPVLTLFKIQTFSFIERLDYVVVAEWMMIILPNMVLLMWGVTYGMKRLYKVPQKTSLYLVALMLLIGCTFIDQHFQIQRVINAVDQFGLWLVYVYPFLLLPLVLIKNKRRKKKGEGIHAK
ncbi:GerAB/ArcD/ProY family transporter [Virgibacillus sp. C22-A2]|uniref:GerAB/ArcD/ProY family transporter n=1 Tax=Virgibacillus tibetensis TaxID=3042313 RepID=A0ABU6KF82_9BACI|nr:GerAB/ArcD/ProY family transporter [Virgibacillus sp. C22-A2]